MSLSGWTLPAAATVIFGLAFIGIYVNIYPISDSDTQSAAEVVIPVLEAEDEEPITKPLEDDASTPIQSPPSEVMETAPDPWTSERMEAASKEPFVEEPKKLDEALNKAGVASGNLASRPADPVFPKVESPSFENTTASFQNPAQSPIDQYTDVTPQPALSQTSPSDLPAGTETVPQPPLNLPTDTQQSPQTPSGLPADTEATSPKPPASPDTTTSPHLPADSPPPIEDKPPIK